MRRARGFNLLVVDDEPLHRSLLRNVFEERGYRVQVARGSKDALAAVDRHVPDLVLLDISLGTENGYAVAKVLRARCGDGIWILALTARGEKDQKRAEAAGFDDWLSKPFDIEDLVATVRHYLEGAAEPGAAAAPPSSSVGSVLRSLTATLMISTAILREPSAGEGQAD